jgi:hypothetical protein
VTGQSNTGVSELLRANLHEVFLERDPDARRAAIERTYAEDVRFIDAEAEAVGRDAIGERVASLSTDSRQSSCSRRTALSTSVAT